MHDIYFQNLKSKKAWVHFFFFFTPTKPKWFWQKPHEISRIFLENNYKIQTILLVRKRFKLMWFLTIRVQIARFLGYKIEYILLEFSVLPAAEVGPRRPEIEFIGLVL